MSEKKQNLSSVTEYRLTNCKDTKVGIVVAEWNHEITNSLYEGALDSLIKSGISEENIIKIDVPGAYELIYGAKHLCQTNALSGVIAIGCVIQGGTPHFDFICDAVANGLMNLNIAFDCPFIFGVLTTNTYEQALERAGGIHGNKGVEAAVTLLKLIELKQGR